MTPQQLQIVLQQRLSLPSVVRQISATGAVQAHSRLSNVALQGPVLPSGTRPSFVAAFTKSLSGSSTLPAFKAPLPPLNAVTLPRGEKRKYDTLRLVCTLCSLYTEASW